MAVKNFNQHWRPEDYDVLVYDMLFMIQRAHDKAERKLHKAMTQKMTRNTNKTTRRRRR